jgi:hypothetical protein
VLQRFDYPVRELVVTVLHATVPRSAAVSLPPCHTAHTAHKLLSPKARGSRDLCIDGSKVASVLVQLNGLGLRVGREGWR